MGVHLGALHLQTHIRERSSFHFEGFSFKIVEVLVSMTIKKQLVTKTYKKLNFAEKSPRIIKLIDQYDCLLRPTSKHYQKHWKERDCFGR